VGFIGLTFSRENATMPKIKAGSIHINYEIVGEGDPLLLIMGFMAPGAAWVPSLPMLSMFQCLYFDNRGTGLSDKPEGIYTIEQMADDAANLLEALSISKVKVFGASMGGMIAQELVLRHPEQVERVVLGCTLPGGPNSKMAPPEIGLKLMEVSKTLAADMEKAVEGFISLGFPEDFVKSHPNLKTQMMEHRSDLPPTPPETADRTRPGIMSFNAYDRLPQIQCPVLIVHGDKDLLIPVENAHILKSRIPQAELYIISGAGHMFLQIDSVKTHQRIVEFLKKPL
jgi:3-oxoadipate enol-lactonase